ncbi:MAG: hypothetical protein JWN82_489 [Candidatus Saccharibacteria bacterium]|nr:hypothetical protein [Candidatus Saccharibacteria bacterium]
MDSNSTDPKQALVDKLKSSTNILVTVSANPSVDQLAACLGLTLWLNKIDKHATAVFSGNVPSTIEFLQPEDTLEKNTDSLRDFIIALDKSKADKLRYKVEDTVVKIFITPYRTNLTADDLEFSQGDFNVDMVVALGVHAQQDLDTAITAHGRILHDATVATITTGDAPSELGSISWHDAQASSLSELVVDLGNTVDKAQLDSQIATALLTGVVAETARFSNEKTTPQTMSISAQLMSAGANQQLVASKLDEPQAAPQHSSEPAAVSSQDGTLEINHPVDEQAAPVPEADAPAETKPDFELPPVADQPPEVTDVKTTSSDLNTVDQPALADAVADDHESRLITEPPTLGGTLTANSRPDDVMLEPSSDPLSQPDAAAEQPLLDRDSGPADAPVPAEPVGPQPAPPSWMPPQPWMGQPAANDDKTLADIEREVDSPHLAEPAADLSSARDEVMKAIDSTPNYTPEPIQALNAHPIELNPPVDEPASTPAAPSAPASTAFDPTAFGISNDPEVDVTPTTTVPEPELTGPVAQPFTLPVPSSLTPPPANPVPPTSASSDASAPPPVPPPLMPPGFPPAR